MRSKQGGTLRKKRQLQHLSTIQIVCHKVPQYALTTYLDVFSETFFIQAVMVTVAHNSSASYTLSGGTSQSHGRSTLVEVGQNLEGKKITSITSIGKEPPTQAESEQALAILSILQGTLSLLDNH